MTIMKMIAKDEWRYWWRSKLATSVMIVGLILIAGSSILTTRQMTDAAHERAHLQSEAEDAFFSQPNRHPHRMVHYGHYAFRVPPPLGIIDPGIDAYTGNSIFLEGHRQNSAMFADRQASSELAIFGALTPALLLQTLAPLLLVLIGYNVITREREARTFDQLIAQGTKPLKIMIGKGYALVSVAGLMIVPLFVAIIFATLDGEPFVSAGLFIVGYALYLLIWCVGIVLVSTMMRTPSASLGALLAAWVVVAILIPRISSNTAVSLVDAPGKIETDFAVIEAVSKIGDGHNAADPAFAALRANMLQQYNVDKVEDLPVNFRGVVAGVAEANLTDILNRFAEERMQVEAAQANIARYFGWLSPVLGIREFSMKIAGVDLEAHHRFLRETEALRFDFVQSLNKVHAEKLTFADDANRSNNAEAEKRTRVSAENWKVLDEFNFSPLPANNRIENASMSLIKLVLWLILLLALCRVVGRRAL
jgi:ABC-2 type transport system permease protein